ARSEDGSQALGIQDRIRNRHEPDELRRRWSPVRRHLVRMVDRALEGDRGGQAARYAGAEDRPWQRDALRLRPSRVTARVGAGTTGASNADPGATRPGSAG